MIQGLSRGFPKMKGGRNHLRIVFPMSNGGLASRLALSEYFVFIDVVDQTIGHISYVQPHTHPAILHPWWLVESGVHVVITRGMGEGSLGFLEKHGVEVVFATTAGRPEDLVKKYLQEMRSPTEGALKN